jgi:hypothetical protein
MTNQVEQGEKRLNRRVKLNKLLKVRPSEPRDEDFQDLPTSINVSQRGIFFHTRQSGYYKGMRLFITFPFTFVNDPMNVEYVAEVVRVEKLSHNRFGVAVHLIMTV